MSAVQLRLGFDEPTSAVTLLLKSSGLRVTVECHHGSVNDAHAYLASAGVQPEMVTAGITFPLSKFKDLQYLSENVTALADPVLKPLLDWVEHPPDDNIAAELELGPDGTLWLSWVHNASPFSEHLSPASATAVLYADIPFVAAPEPLAVMRSASHLPLLVAKCRPHRSGYIEIETAKPQLLEMQKIPGLFRLDDTTYGLPFAAAGALDGKMGFVWDGPVPQLERGPRQLPPMPAKLSPHVTEDLRRLVDSLAAYRTQLVAWDSGLGRRVFVLAALVSLDAFPALVVTRPARVWQWWRHAALFSRTRGVDAEDVDIRVVTYEEFVKNPSLAYHTQTLIFDDVASSDADTPEVAAAAVSIGGLVDCYLVGVTDELPTDPKQLAGVMARLRPAEFSTSTPLMDRYGTNFKNGLFQHAAAYLSHRDAPLDDAAPVDMLFNHTQVRRVYLNDELRKDLNTLRASDPAEDLAAREQELISAGSAYTLSPKIALASGMAEDALNKGQRCALVTKYRKTASMLASLLRAHHPEVVRPGEHPTAKSRLTLVEGMTSLPDLGWFDQVIVLDYPDSYFVLDRAVGHPDATYAPSVVTLLHAADTIDDKLAMSAARAEEQALNTRGTIPKPDLIDISTIFDDMFPAEQEEEEPTAPTAAQVAETAVQAGTPPLQPKAVPHTAVDRLTLKPILGPNQWAYSSEYDSDDNSPPRRPK